MAIYFAPVVLSTGNTDIDGSTGTVYDVVTGGLNGTFVSTFFVKAQGTTTSGMIRMFWYNNIDNRLLEEVIVTAITPGAGVETWEGTIAFNSTVPKDYIIRFSTHNTETFVVFPRV